MGRSPSSVHLSRTWHPIAWSGGGIRFLGRKGSIQLFESNWVCISQHSVVVEGAPEESHAIGRCALFVLLGCRRVTQPAADRLKQQQAIHQQFRAEILKQKGRAATFSSERCWAECQRWDHSLRWKESIALNWWFEIGDLLIRLSSQCHADLKEFSYSEEWVG